LKYTVMNFGIGRGDRPNIPQVKGADVKMTGSGRTLVYSLLSPIIDEEIGIEFLESFWNQEGTNAPVTREQLMTVLASVSLIPSVVFPFIFNSMTPTSVLERTTLWYQ